MPHDVTLPDLGVSISAGTVSRWLKQVGDAVAEGEPLVEISTDKVDTEIASPVGGRLLEIRVHEDDTTEIGSVLAVIGEPEPAPAPATPAYSPPQYHQPTSTPDNARTYATPLVRKLADEYGVDLASVSGTGVGGRIRKEDVLAAASRTADEPGGAAAGPGAGFAGVSAAGPSPVSPVGIPLYDVAPEIPEPASGFATPSAAALPDQVTMRPAGEPGAPAAPEPSAGHDSEWTATGQAQYDAQPTAIAPAQYDTEPAPIAPAQYDTEPTPTGQAPTDESAEAEPTAAAPETMGHAAPFFPVTVSPPDAHAFQVTPPPLPAGITPETAGRPTGLTDPAIPQGEELHPITPDDAMELMIHPAPLPGPVTPTDDAPELIADSAAFPAPAITSADVADPMVPPAPLPTAALSTEDVMELMIHPAPLPAPPIPPDDGPEPQFHPAPLPTPAIPATEGPPPAIHQPQLHSAQVYPAQVYPSGVLPADVPLTTPYPPDTPPVTPYHPQADAPPATPYPPQAPPATAYPMEAPPATPYPMEAPPATPYPMEAPPATPYPMEAPPATPYPMEAPPATAFPPQFPPAEVAPPVTYPPSPYAPPPPPTPPPPPLPDDPYLAAHPATGQSAVMGSMEKLSAPRASQARRMVQSLQTSAQATATLEVDVTLVSRLRATDAFMAHLDPRIMHLACVAKAACEALRHFPKFKASIDVEAGEIRYADVEHVGVVVTTQKGPIIPVILSAGDLSVAGWAKRISDLETRVITGQITPDELIGGTFTITNYGGGPTLFDTPLINQPQVAILGCGAVTRRPVVLDDPELGEIIAMRDMMYLSVSYDQRLIDATDAGRFLGWIRARLEGGDFATGL